MSVADMAASADVDEIKQGVSKLDFHHPFTPYDVQNDFMRTVYRILETGDGQVGILESPTGTGKSLSLICASLTWLRQKKATRHEAAIQKAKDALQDEPSWLVDQLMCRKREELFGKWEEREKRLEAIRHKERAALRNGRDRKRRRIDDTTNSARRVEDEEAEFLLDEPGSHEAHPDDALSGLSKESREVLESMGLGSFKTRREEDDSVLEEEVKIYYASRTHSQLSQFISELRRPRFPSSLPSSVTTSKTPASHEPVKLLPLSSRQKLCINPSVARLNSAQAINDRCSELQQAKSEKRCSFAPRGELREQVLEFRDGALARLPDIEDLHLLGKSLSVCPYYASRSTLPGAEIITLPYPLLLQKSAREALGIKLEGNVVIIDEAHNIMDAIANVHAAELKLTELRKGRSMLGVYVRKFGKKLKGVNRANVGRVGRIMESLTEWMEGALNSKQEHGIVDPNDLAKHKGADQIDLFGLIQYIHESKLAYKIESYAAYAGSESTETPAASTKSATPVLHTLVSFLVALTNLSSEGRIFFQKVHGNPADIQLSFLLLSPTHAFSSIASSARAVILAGGTMSPFEDYRDHLFPSLTANKITTLSCRHVIPAENLCVWTLASTRPGANPLEFNYRSRENRGMTTDLGLAVLNICALVPDGVVVFFASYGYLDEVVTAWQQPQEGSRQTIWERLEARKSIFRETKTSTSEQVLQEYSLAILGERAPDDKRNGALLLSVVGGKMSEGINFSDRLGRCVVVVGLPYPNIASAEWKAKMEYIETTTATRLIASGSLSREEAAARGKSTARDFYENACMRAVNQSIGRAIRHRGDYAAIVLIDRRYGTDKIRGKLPGWIQDGLERDSHEKGLGGLMGALGKFFRTKIRKGS